MDLVSMDAKELHEAIEDGDMEHVRHLLQGDVAGQHFLYEETSALFQAFSYEEYEIASFLIHKGAKFNASEIYDLYNLEIDLTRINSLLLDYNKKSQKSCIFQLMSWSQSPQGLDGECLNSVMCMYEAFFKSEILKLLMMVLESEPVDLVYDFESEDVNRIHRLYEEESEIYGLTLTFSKEIYIGAKNLLSDNSRKRTKVYGVVAEELCHLAMETLFNNSAKPYREDHSKLNQDFLSIVEAVQHLAGHSCHIESVIKDVFFSYPGSEWECELIARVPHVIGIYGEEFGRQILQESSELSRLLLFYEENVIPQCKAFLDPSLNTRTQRRMESLMKKSDIISFQEKKMQPLKEGFASFREYLVEEKGIFVIVTNCIKLCTLHVYHELEREYQQLLWKKCLFFARKCLERKRNEIINAFKVKAWDYLVIVLDENEFNLQKFKYECLDHFDKKTKGMKIIIIAGSQSLSCRFPNKVLNYKWNDLNEHYKNLHQEIKYALKGEEYSIYVQKKDFPKVFSEEDITRIISGVVIEVSDGAELFSEGYTPETYIKREFKVLTVDKKVFQVLPPDTSIFLSGMRKSNFPSLSVNEKMVQWLQESDDEIEEGKSIFIVTDEGAMTFEKFTTMNYRKFNIWLHHIKNEFILRNSNLSGDFFKQYVKQVSRTENEMLHFLKRERTVIISDNAGCGKSTAISSIIGALKKNDHHSWLWRINLNKFSTDMRNPLSLANINANTDDEEVFDYFFRMLGVNGLEKPLFRKLTREGHCFIFFDGFDEIPSRYKNNALKILSTLREKTAVNITVATRKQEDLESLLNVYSHQLVPLSKEMQIMYLENLWKSKLKYPSGEGMQVSQKDHKAISEKIKRIIKELRTGMSKLDIEYLMLVLALEKIDLGKSLDFVRSEMDNLNFTLLANCILDKTSLNKNASEFMGIPLHLYMIGIIHYNGNFNVEIPWDMYCIYLEFIDRKILIYLEEKQGLWHDGKVKDDMMKIMRKEAGRIHMKLADLFFNEKKVELASSMNDEDYEFCSALGIAFIHHGEIQFLHQTFVEYFEAEFLRKNIKKEILFALLFEKKYIVVRLFLSAALEWKKFENVTKELFNDVDFLVTVMKRIVDASPMYAAWIRSTYKSDLYCCFKIVKKLLEAFEEICEVDFADKFAEKVEQRFKEGREDESLVHYSYYHKSMYFLGACLPVNMMKYLITRNFKFRLVIILNFVTTSADPHEVKHLLKYCISAKIVGECGSRLCNTDIDEKDAEAKNLLDLLNLEASPALYFHGLSNDRAEIFAHLLKFLRDVLGRERFINTVVQSFEYEKQINIFIENQQPNKIFSLFEALHSVFGDEMEILFDVASKFRVITKAVEGSEFDGWSGLFEKVVSLFAVWFGKDGLAEVMLTRDRYGKYLAHKLMYCCSNAALMKYLNIIKDILDGKDKMRQFLMVQNSQSMNIFHLCALMGNIPYKSNLYDLLRFCAGYFEKGEIKGMLLSDDENGNNIIFFLALGNSTETLMKNLAFIKEFFGDDRWFKEILVSKGEYFRNILHFAAMNQVELNPSFLNSYLSEGEIANLLMERDEDGRTCLHTAALWKRNFLVLLDYVNDALRFDRDQFVELILGEDIHGNSFLHWLGKCFKRDDKAELLKKILDSLRGKISDELYQKLLRVRNDEGQTFLQIEQEFSEEFVKCCKEVVEEDFFEELLLKKCNNGNHSSSFK